MQETTLFTWNYRVTGEICRDPNYLLLKAIDKENQIPVVLKVINAELPGPEEIARLENEYQIIKSLEGVPGVIRTVGIVAYKKTRALVLSFIDGTTLDALIKNGPLRVNDFIHFALRLSGIIGEIHSRNIIHKDIKSRNIILKPEKREIYLVDYSLSGRFSREQPLFTPLSTIEGSLSYISPEQTGRINRLVDYRSDFYSLGVTFYQMATGTLPFTIQDPMALIHAHISTPPPPPHFVNQKIPEVISDIILKLLAKNPEERYQSSYGLSRDLEQCRYYMENTGHITGFQVGLFDRPENFSYPQKVYGRDKELNALMNSFWKIKSGKTVLSIISGPPGTGKSQLTGELRGIILQNQGYFISGEFNKKKQDIPYGGLGEALEKLGRLLLLEGEEQQKKWKTRISETVGINGKIITTLAPSFEYILGPQPEIQEIPFQEAHNRFHLLLVSFIGLFATPEHPLVLFLDNMQWADKRSLMLVEHLLTMDNTGCFQLIIAGRETNNKNRESIEALIHKAEKRNIEVLRLTPSPLDGSDIENILHDIFKKKDISTKQLASVIFEKTGGNPFFVKEFIQTLYREKRIEYNREWKWDLEQIRLLSVTTNIVDLLVKGLKLLPPGALTIIKILACSKSTFSPFILKETAQIDEETFNDHLFLLNNLGYLYKREETYCFSHTKIAEAAYSLCKEDEKTAYHYKIGLYLLEKTEEDTNLKKNLYTIVNQWNNCLKRLNKDQNSRFIDLNFLAGNLAKREGAYESAFSFYKQGIRLLRENSWDSCYEKTFPLHLAEAEALYLINSYDDSYKKLVSLKEKARSIEHKGEVYYRLITLFSIQGKLKEAIECGYEAARYLGYGLPRKHIGFFFFKELLLCTLLLIGKNRQNIMALKKMTDPAGIMAVRIFSLLGIIMASQNNAIIPLVGLKCMTINLLGGISPDAPMSFCYYGILQAYFFKNTAKGYRYGQIALELTGPGREYLKSMIMCNNLACINYRKDDLPALMEQADKAYRMARDSGAFQYMVYILASTITQRFLFGVKLQDILKIIKQQKEELLLNDEKYGIITICTNYSALLYLTDPGEDEQKDKLPFIDDFLEKCGTDSANRVSYDRISRFHINTCGLMIAYFERDFKKARTLIKESRQYLKLAHLIPQYMIFFFYKALTFAVDSGQGTGRQGKKELKAIKSVLKLYKKAAADNPALFEGKYMLLQAEYYRLTGKDEAAGNKYRTALVLTRKRGLLNDLSAALECCARFYISRGDTEIGAMYIKQAADCFYSWGALRILSRLQKEYKELIAGENGLLRERRKSARPSSSDSASFFSDDLDLTTILKTSRAISSEIELKGILEKLLHIVIENAGAQKALIILADEQGDYYIEAETDTFKKEKTSVLKPVPFRENAKNLCPSVVSYTLKTGKAVVINSNEGYGQFSGDSYLNTHTPQSVLTSPILKQQTVKGVVYLENRSVAGAFTTGRLKLIKLISAQIVISIENARLVEHLKEKERLKQEMAIAKRIQTSLSPDPPEQEDFEIAPVMYPAGEVGGDYYDLILDKEQKLWIAMGDVSGHGVTAGLIMMMAESSLHTVINELENPRPGEAINAVNTLLFNNVGKRLKTEHFMSLIFLKQIKKGRFLYAGLHEHLVLFREKTKKMEIIPTSGLYCGMLENIDHVTRDYELILEKGDILVLFTDGIIETRNEERKLFGLAGLNRIILKHHTQSCEKIQEELINASLAWSKGIQKDDMTLIVLRMK